MRQTWSLGRSVFVVGSIALASCIGPAGHKGGAEASGTEGSNGDGNGGGSVAGTAYTWKNVTILGGGFVTGVIFSRVEKDVIYARTDIGGAYRWDPKGEWIPITDGLSRAKSNFLGIESVAADPVDANRVYMAVGTYTQDWAGTGAMMRSSDRGENWDITELPIKMGGNENGRSNGEKLVVDPNHPELLYFGSRKDGLWKSEDRGATWKKDARWTLGSEPLGVGITFLLFDEKSGKAGKPTPTLYAGYASTDAGLYRSTDAGATWKPVPGQPKGLMPSHAGFDASGTLYLSYGNVPGPSDVVNGAVYAFDPKKTTFTDVTPVKPELTKKEGQDKFGYGGLSVDPGKTGSVLVTTIDRWTKGDEIFRTTDGGKKWLAIGPKASRDIAGAKYLYWDHDKPSSTGWMGDCDLDPHNPGRAMYVTGQGIWKTDDLTEADADKPTHWAFTNKGLEETVAIDLASPPSGPVLLSGVGDICGFRHDDVDVAPPTGMFQNPIFGNVTNLDFAANKPNLVVRVGQGGNSVRGAFSDDAGKSWTPFSKHPQDKQGGFVAITADGSTIVWAAKDAPTAYSLDRGKTWKPSEGLPPPAELPDWAPNHLQLVADRVNAKKLYVYDALTGKAYSSADGGKSFTLGYGSLPTLADWALTPASIEAVPGVEGDVWITTGKELFRSEDSGESYSAKGAVEESYAIGFGAAAPGAKFPAVYLSGKVEGTTGLFRSDDAGETFVRINDDRHQFGTIDSIIGDPRRYGRVYAGTAGRGIVYGDPK